uniref:Uncharacterized protein n=1 Tax=Lactuca sativa TaxID=4236 RepID=A0A9R1WJS7_LACSA|nr:hypothetical protein LSAT_V11C100034170 [Lactuca sativa]
MKITYFEMKNLFENLRCYIATHHYVISLAGLLECGKLDELYLEIYMLITHTSTKYGNETNDEGTSTRCINDNDMYMTVIRDMIAGEITRS